MIKKTCSLCGVKKTPDTKSKCQACFTKLRRIRTKLAAVQLLGGKCARCEHTANLQNSESFEFHHPNNAKEFSIGMQGNKSWDNLKDEILKCELLCSICHRLEHSNRTVKFIKAALKYNGQNEEIKELLDKYSV